LVEDAVRTPCAHLYCKACLMKALELKHECPLDHCPLVPSQVTEDKIIQRTIGSLPCFCNQKDRGCEWKGTVSEIKGHEASCLYEIISCKYIGCGQKMLRSELAKHLLVCEFKETGEEQAKNQQINFSALDDRIRQSQTNEVQNGHANSTLRQRNPPDQIQTHYQTQTRPQNSPFSNLHQRRANPPITSNLSSPFTYFTFLFKLVFFPRKLHQQIAEADQTFITLVWIIAMIAASLPFATIYAFVPLKLFPISLDTDLRLRTGGFLFFVTIVTCIVKRGAVKIPFLFGVNIVDEIPVKCFFAFLFAASSVVSIRKSFDFLEMGIVSASTVGIFVISYLRYQSFHFTMKFAVLELLITITSIGFVGLRSSLNLGYSFDIAMFVYSIILAFLIGSFLEIVIEYGRAHNLIADEYEKEFLFHIFLDWMVSIGSNLFISTGLKVCGLEMIYIISAANHVKLFVWFGNFNGDGMLSKRSLLFSILSYVLWCTISVLAFLLARPRVCEWRVSDFDLLYAPMICLSTLCVTHSAMLLGRKWIKWFN